MKVKFSILIFFLILLALPCELEARDYYSDLGVNPRASEEEIRQAYRRIAAKEHPDRNPGDEEALMRFKQAGEAYDVLGDPEKRAIYDGNDYTFTTPDEAHSSYPDFDSFLDRMQAAAEQRSADWDLWQTKYIRDFTRGVVKTYRYTVPTSVLLTMATSPSFGLSVVLLPTLGAVGLASTTVASVYLAAHGMQFHMLSFTREDAEKLGRRLGYWAGVANTAMAAGSCAYVVRLFSGQ